MLYYIVIKFIFVSAGYTPFKDRKADYSWLLFHNKAVSFLVSKSQSRRKQKYFSGCGLRICMSIATATKSGILPKTKQNDPINQTRCGRAHGQIQTLKYLPNEYFLGSSWHKYTSLRLCLLCRTSFHPLSAMFHICCLGRIAWECCWQIFGCIFCWQPNYLGLGRL